MADVVERVGDLYEAGAGCSIESAVRGMVGIADATGQVTFLNPNDTIVRVKPGSHPSDLVFQFRKDKVDQVTGAFRKILEDKVR